MTATDLIGTSAISWADLATALSQKCGKEINFCGGQKAARIGADNGYFSEVYLIAPDWDEPDLPREIVLKFYIEIKEYEEAQQERGEAVDPAMVQLLAKSHNAECLAYELFEKYGEGRLPVPRVYALSSLSPQNPSKGCLVMESLSSLAPATIYEGLTVDQVREILPALAETALLKRKLSDGDLKRLDRHMFKERFCPGLYDKKLVAAYIPRLRQHRIEGLPAKIDELEGILWQLTSMSMFERIDGLCDELGMEPVLVNGDLWPANLMMTGEGRIGKIIDFQYFALSSPAVDLVSLLTSCLSSEDRRQFTASLLEEYFWAVSSKLGGLDLPFSLEQLKMSYARVFPFVAFNVHGILEHQLSTKRHIMSPATIEKAERKLLAMIEDIISVYKMQDWSSK